MPKCLVGKLILVSMLSAVNAAHAAPATDLHVNSSPGVGAGIVGTAIEVAEQFTVPVGQTWRVTGVEMDGFASPGPLHTVRFYSGGGGAPGFTVCERTNAEAIGQFVSSISRIVDPELRLANPCEPGAGTYFVGVRMGRGLQRSWCLLGADGYPSGRFRNLRRTGCPVPERFRVTDFRCSSMLRQASPPGWCLHRQ